MVIGVLMIMNDNKDFKFNHQIREILAEIGKALIIAAVLGFTVDMALKKNLAGDALETAFGYTLPAELRDCMKWLYGLKWLCISSRLEIKLADGGLEDRLEVTRTYRRTLQNITNNIERINPYTHVGEYFFDNYASEIVLLRYKIGNDGWVPVLADQGARRSTLASDPTPQSLLKPYVSFTNERRTVGMKLFEHQQLTPK